MITILFGFAVATLLTCVVSFFLWSKVHFGWLSRICHLLILSLPFEYFPRVELGGASWRISQVLVIIGFWIILILALKKDNRFLSHKLHFATLYPVLFFILSSLSWFAVQDWQRFIVHLFGTIFVFGAFILLANFATNVWKNLQRLAIVLFGCSIFGLYQFFGDLLGIPPAFTLLREHYTKIVFGVPRVQGTAVEPLYFAGMLLIAIFTLVFWICQKVEVKNNYLKENCHLERSERSLASICKTSISSMPKENRIGEVANPTEKWNFLKFISNQPQRIFGYAQDDNHIILIRYLIFVFLTIFTVFLLTISKGTFGVLAILTLPLLVVILFSFEFVRVFVKKFVIQTLLMGILGLSLFLTFVNPIGLLGEIGTNFIETISGTSASAVERGMFVSEAIVGIKQNPIFGIGMGQYGDYVGKNLGALNEDGKAIVNNVYLEIWIEEGVLALFFFIFMLVQPIFMLLGKLANYKNSSNSTSQFKLASISIIFILVGYYIQWTLFSPIFIMPIFICLGLAYNLVLSKDS